MPSSLKTILVLLAVAVAFNLGRYSVEFNGSTAAWIAVDACVVALIVSLVALIMEFRKPGSAKSTV